MSDVLFLCSGNFYRSRFAEACFNFHAVRRQLHCRAESRGFRLNAANVGPLSPHTISALRERGMHSADPPRDPLVVTTADFARYSHIVALKEAEHRPMMQMWFPEWVDHIEYWHVDDIDCAAPGEALVLLEANILELQNRWTAPAS